MREKYNEYLGATGDVAARLRQIGYSINLLSPGARIGSFEEFVAVVSALRNAQIQEMRAILKKCFKNYLRKNDLLALLQAGKDPLSDTEVREACHIIPLDREDGIHVDDFVNFLYS